MKHVSVRIIAVLCLVTVGAAGRQQNYTFSANVDLVVLNVHVTDSQRQAVSGLTAADFTILEDGKPQPIALFSGQDAPVSAGLVIDASTSMAVKWPDVRVAADSFARDSNPQNEMFILTFNQDLRWALPAGKHFTSNPADLDRGMKNINRQGATAIYDAVAAGLDRLAEGHFDRKILVVVSDGEDNVSKQGLEPLLVRLQRASVPVYAVGIADHPSYDRNQKPMIQLASATGGESFFPGNPIEIRRSLDHIAQAVRTQYMLGYYPKDSPDGKYHKLTVPVKPTSHPSVHIETRPGYYAPEATRPEQ